MICQRGATYPWPHDTPTPPRCSIVNWNPLTSALQLGAEGKRLRPTMLLLLASSLSASAPSAAMLTVDETPHSSHPTDTRRRQQRIAEITEMIHVASLLHDDVIDSAETRRGLKALNSVMGNKVRLQAALQPFFFPYLPSYPPGEGARRGTLGCLL